MNPTALRHQLLAAGFCPVPVCGKAPVQKGWQNRTAPARCEIECWAQYYPDATNTGALTRLMPTLDIDIRNPDAAEAVEALARERFEERGRVLVRIGNAPKRAIPFCTAKPFSKIAVHVIAPNGDADQKIEMLGDGQQIVVAGLHPDIKKPYGWHGGTPGAIRHTELPLINADEAHALVDDAVTLLVRDFGYRLAQVQQSEGRTVTPPAKWRALVKGVAAGQRNSAAASLCGHLLRRRIDPFVVLELVQAWNATRCSPPLPESEIERTVASIAKREFTRRSGNGG
jgi:hypothetical protein